MVSRTSVREALRALQSRGLIEIRAGEGAFVRDISVEALIEPLALVILPAPGGGRGAVRGAPPARAGDRCAGGAARDPRRAGRDGAHPRRAGQGGRPGPDGAGQDAALHAAIAQQRPQPRDRPYRQRARGPLAQSREECLHTPGRPTRSHQDHVRILGAIRGATRWGRAARCWIISSPCESLVTGLPGRRGHSRRVSNKNQTPERQIRLEPLVSARCARIFIDRAPARTSE